MKLRFRILLSFLFMWGLATAGAAQSSPQTELPAGKAPAASPVPSTDQENAHKARMLLEEAIQTLGGQAYLAVRDLQQSGRAYSFFHGRPRSNGVLRRLFTQFHAEERIESS